MTGRAHLCLFDRLVCSALVALNFVLQPRPLLLDLAKVLVFLRLELFELVALFLGLLHSSRSFMLLPRNLVLQPLPQVLDLLELLVLLVERGFELLDGVALLGLGGSKAFRQVGNLLLERVDALLHRLADLGCASLVRGVRDGSSSLS